MPDLHHYWIFAKEIQNSDVDHVNSNKSMKTANFVMKDIDNFNLISKLFQDDICSGTSLQAF